MKLCKAGLSDAAWKQADVYKRQLQGAVRMILTKVDAFVSGIGKILAHAFDLIGDAGKCPWFY